MEKLRFITSALLWLQLRDARNRVAHEYLTDELHRLYETIVTQAVPEFALLSRHLQTLLEGD